MTAINSQQNWALMLRTAMSFILCQLHAFVALVLGAGMGPMAGRRHASLAIQNVTKF